MLIAFVFGLGVVLVVPVGGLVWWTRWLGGVYGAPLWIRRLVWIHAAIGALAAASMFWTVGEIHRALDAPNTSAADRQRILANGIAVGLYDVTLFVAVLGVAALGMVLLTWRYRWSPRRERKPETPPYQ